MSDLVASDIFVLKEAEKKVSVEKETPAGFVPVNFSSKDKLGPSILHFRNYSMNELLDLASSNEENQLKELIKVLNSMCFEKYDCSKLHVENIKEILLTLYANFWGSSLKNKPFYKDLNGDLNSEDNIGYVDIPLNQLDVINIDDKVKIPFAIIDDATNKKVKFTLPTVENIFISEKFIKEKYSNREGKYRTIKALTNTYEQLIKKELYEEANKIQIDEDLKQEYEEFEKEKSKDSLRVLQAQLIYEVDGKKLETLEEKLNAFNNSVDSITWVRYSETVKEKIKFGVSDKFTFKYNEEKITRSFSFRLLDFIPSVDETRNTGYTVQFDD